MAKNVVDLMSTPPPPSTTKITRETIPEPPSISPIDICKNAMPKTLKERFDWDRDFQVYIKKFPELLTSVQKITTKCPLFEAGGSRLPAPQPSQVPQRLRTVAVISLTFQRNPNNQAEVVASRTTSLIRIDLEPNPPANEQTWDEEGENMDEINREIDELFSDL